MIETERSLILTLIQQQEQLIAEFGRAVTRFGVRIWVVFNCPAVFASLDLRLIAEIPFGIVVCN